MTTAFHGTRMAVCDWQRMRSLWTSGFVFLAVALLAVWSTSVWAKDVIGQPIEMSIGGEVMSTVEILSPQAYKAYCRGIPPPSACAGILQPGTEK
jgi:hypothetical protein